MEEGFISVLGDSTFVFVHGAHGGAWVWDKLTPLLSRLGHKTYVLDLPGHGVDFSPLAEQTLQSYTDKVLSVLDAIKGKVVLVGHSMGGAVITCAGEARPEKIDKLVYISAAMLRPGQSVNGPEGMVPVDWGDDLEQEGRVLRFEKLARRVNVAEMVGKEDYDNMVKNSYGEALEPLNAKVYPTGERWGSIRRFFVFCGRDKANEPAVQRELIKNNPCERVYYVDTDHYPQLSTPVELTVILHEIAKL